MDHPSFIAPMCPIMQQNIVETMIHVLVVDSDNNESPLVQMLEYLFFYKVTIVKSASTALSIIATEPCYTFDVVLENVNAFDWCGVAFLQRAEDIGLPVIMLLDDDDAALTLKALELGASLCLKKPMPMEWVKNLWQYAYFHKLRNRRKNTQVVKHLGWTNGFGEVVDYIPDRKKARCSAFVAQGGGLGRLQQFQTDPLPKKAWTEWTVELHEKFMDAVRFLGEGRCYPKNILKVMNVPDLTRIQVASHLQKCRSGTWHVFPRGRRSSKISPPSRASNGRCCSNQRAAPRRYGIMPQLYLDKPPQESPNNKTFMTTTTAAADEGDDQHVMKWCSSGSHPFPQQPHHPYVDQFEGFNMDEVFMNTAAQRFVFDAPSDSDGSNTLLPLGANNAITEDFFDINIPNMIDFMGLSLASTSQEPEVTPKSTEDSNQMLVAECIKKVKTEI